MSTGMKQCPFCAEEIRVEAIKCRHCGEAVPAGHTPKQTKAAKPEAEPAPTPTAGQQLRKAFSFAGAMMGSMVLAGFLGALIIAPGSRVGWVFAATAVTFVIVALLVWLTPDESTRTGAALTAVVMVVVIDGAVWYYSNPGSRPTAGEQAANARDQAADSSPPSVEVNLARVDLGVTSPSEAQVRPFVAMLDQLVTRCTEARTMIGDMATRATALIKEDFDRDVSSLFVLEQLVDATEGLPRAECSGRLAPLIVLIGRGG